MNKNYKKERSVRGCETTTTLASFKLEMVKMYINQLFQEDYLTFSEAWFLINNAKHQWLKALESAFLK